MKVSTKMIAILIVLVMALGVFSGCSDSSNDSTLDSSASSTDSVQNDTSDVTDSSADAEDETDSDVEAEVQEDMIGEVYYVYTDSIYIDLYETEAEVTDYTTLDVDTLTSSGMSDDVVTADVTYYYIFQDGVMTESSLEEIEEGDLIAADYDDDGTLSIIILKKVEESDVIAEVTAIEDSTLTLTLYGAISEDTTISDYANVDMTLYEATETTETYTFDGTEYLYIASDGALTEATSEDVAVGDVLIFYTDESDLPTITIYPAE